MDNLRRNLLISDHKYFFRINTFSLVLLRGELRNVQIEIAFTLELGRDMRNHILYSIYVWGDLGIYPVDSDVDNYLTKNVLSGNTIF